MKKTYNSVEFTTLVPLRSSLGTLSLASAELTKVLGRLGNDVCVQKHLDPAKGLTCGAWSGNVLERPREESSFIARDIEERLITPCLQISKRQILLQMK